jgi:hypothetical protein
VVVVVAWQVDVVDAEYAALQREMEAASDFQYVLRAHKHFLANVLRLSLLDNASVQEGLERILHICLRFIAVCRLMHQSELGPGEQQEQEQMGSRQKHQQSAAAAVTAGARGSGRGRSGGGGGAGGSGVASSITPPPAPAARVPPIYIPPEEVGSIRADFLLQVSLLFQVMRKVESRGFVFRLDFNGYLSNAALEHIGHGGAAGTGRGVGAGAGVGPGAGAGADGGSGVKSSAAHNSSFSSARYR